jgi:Flp pilus assembly protein TadD
MGESDLTAQLIADGRAALAKGRLVRARLLTAPLTEQAEHLPPEQRYRLWTLRAEIEITAQAPEQALCWAQRAHQVAPSHPWANHILAVVLRDLGRRDEALAAWRTALLHDPEFDQAYQGLATTLARSGDFAQAEQVYAQWAERRPDDPTLSLSRGLTLARACAYAEAEDCLIKACNHAQTASKARIALAWVLRRQGQLDAAASHLRAIPPTDPDYPEARWALASILLLQGKFRDGFAAFEARFQRGRNLIRETGLPLWDGKSSTLAGQRLLILQEQGVGDAFQMVRFAAPLADAGATVLWEASRSCAAVLAQAAGVAKVVPPGEADQQADLCCPMMSLPFLLNAAPASLPGGTRYLSAPGPRPDLPFARTDDAIHIGIVWRGNPSHDDDAARSIPLPWLAPLLSHPLTIQGRPVRWVSLQPSSNRPDYDPAVHDSWFTHDFGPTLTSFDQTAHLLEALDALVSVDTAVLHLSAALGRPTYGLLPFACDWRWAPQANQGSPWYPTLRLLRCPTPYQPQTPTSWHTALDDLRSVLFREGTLLKATLADKDRGGRAPGVGEEALGGAGYGGGAGADA